MSGVGGFLRWWGNELAACMPKAWRSDRARPSPRLEFALAPHEVVIRHVTNGGGRDLGTCALDPDAGAGPAPVEGVRALDPRGTRVAVRLDERARVRKTVELPLAALDDPRQVLAFELHRETPFTAERAYFDFRVIGVDRARGRVRVDLWAAPRSLVDAALAPVASWSLVQDAAHRAAPIEDDVLWFHAPGYRARSAALVNTVLVVANLAVAGVLLAAPITRQHEALARLEPRLAELRSEAAGVATIEERIGALEQQAARLEKQKTQRPPVLLVLDEVAKVLPLDTALERFEMRGGKVTLHGTSTAASALIARFEADAMFRDAHFVSPVTRGADGEERFRLSAELAGGDR